MSVFRAAPIALGLGVFALTLALIPAPARAQSRVIEAPDYVQPGRSRARVVTTYDDEPRIIRRAPRRDDRFIEEMFGDDEPVYQRRVPTLRERQAETRRGGRMALDGERYDRYERYQRAPAVTYGRSYQRYDYDDDYYDATDPRVERLPRQLAGAPSGTGAGVMSRAVDPKFARTTVSYSGGEKAGSIVIDTRSRYLYLVQGGGTAIRYGVGVGKQGFSWKGVETISAKKEWPDWRPPAEMRQRRPELPVMMEGGPDNPLGARALYLGSTLYRIHGSNEPWTIGHAVSSGCIRMTNDDVTDLYERVGVGTSVKVL